MMYVVIDAAGLIVKSGLCVDEDAALLQAGAGQSVLVSTDTDLAYIDDANINVVDGELAPIGGYPPGDVPELTLNAL